MDPRTIRALLLSLACARRCRARPTRVRRPRRFRFPPILTLDPVRGPATTPAVSASALGCPADLDRGRRRRGAPDTRLTEDSTVLYQAGPEQRAPDGIILTPERMSEWRRPYNDFAGTQVLGRAVAYAGVFARQIEMKMS